jgi:hypothetical protein
VPVQAERLVSVVSGPVEEDSLVYIDNWRTGFVEVGTADRDI